MKVLYLSLGKGGSSKSLRVLLLHLMKYNLVEPYVLYNKRSYDVSFESFLITNKISSSCIDFEFDIYPATSTIKDIVMFLPRLVRTVWKNRVAIQKITRIHKIYNFKLIHSNTSCFQVGYYSAQLCNLPHIWHFREYQNLDFSMTPLFSFNNLIKKSQRDANYNIAITRGVFNHFRMCDSNSVVVYNGIEGLNHPEIDLNQSKEKFFLFVGNVTKNKGISDVLKAFSTFSKKYEDYVLKIAGNCSPDYKSVLMTEIQFLGLLNKVVFLGQVYDVYSLMQKSTALVVSSRFEAFGLITAEAMLNYCLVIGKNQGGTKEQFDNGLRLTDNEIALRYISIKDLELQLSYVAENGLNYYDSMLKNARLTVKQLYNPNRYANQIYSFYQKILNNNRYV